MAPPQKNLYIDIMKLELKQMVFCLPITGLELLMLTAVDARNHLYCR